MIQEHRSLPLVAVIAGLLCWALAVMPGPAARADDSGAKAPSYQLQQYPSGEADLAKWLRNEMVPGRTKPRDMFAVFGTRYRHPGDGFPLENHERENASTFLYDLDELGVHDHLPNHVVRLQFDSGTGRLLRAVVEEGPHQTGVHLEAVSGQ